MDLLGQDAAHDGPAVLERHRRVVCDRPEQRAVLVREGRVAVAHELADHTPLPAQRQPLRVGTGAPLRPGDLAVLQHERRPGRADRVHRRLHDRLQRLLEVERLGDRLGDLRERLELADPALRLRIELRMLDRLGDLGGDREQQVHLGRGELPRGARAHVERALELVAASDHRHREDRLVLVLA